MSDAPAPTPVPAVDIDWNAARRFLRRVLSRQLMGTASADLEDLVQESLIKLLRAIRKEPARNLEALMTRIAEWTRIDFIRKRRTWRPILQATDDLDSVAADPAPGPLDGVGDAAERLSFTVLEFFHSRSTRCHELARRYFDDQDWSEVAEALGQSHDAVRQQWSRCLRMLKRAASEQPDLLWTWTRDADTERP